MRTWMTKAAATAAVAVPLAAIVTVADATPASAALYPSGCQSPARGDWDDNCWVGYQYSSNSNMVLGVQTMVRLYSVPGGWCYTTRFLARDGVYGDATKNAIKRWQEGWNLNASPSVTVDGVVGSQMWSVWDTRIQSFYSYTSSGYKYYRNAPQADSCVEDARSFFRMQESGMQYWQVLAPGGGSWAYMIA